MHGCGLWVVLFFHGVSFYLYHSEHFSNLKLQEEYRVLLDRTSI